MTTTIYDRALDLAVEERCAGMTPAEMISTLREMNLLDPTRCKAFLAKEMVTALTDGGMTKIEAMYTAAEHFCCSYECIRKYVYYTYK
ncbi:MAG: hypothetical protein SOZ00_03150 [Tidjanibacter sp.]|nr:hypothetical protein [Tidjanibacter sp.]